MRCRAQHQVPFNPGGDVLCTQAQDMSGQIRSPLPRPRCQQPSHAFYRRRSRAQNIGASPDDQNGLGNLARQPGQTSQRATGPALERRQLRPHFPRLQNSQSIMTATVIALLNTFFTRDASAGDLYFRRATNRKPNGFRQAQICKRQQLLWPAPQNQRAVQERQGHHCPALDLQRQESD